MRLNSCIFKKCKSCNFKSRCTAAQISYIFQECNKIIEHMLKKNVNLAILHKSLSRTMSHKEIKNANLAMLRKSLVLNMIFFSKICPTMRSLFVMRH